MFPPDSVFNGHGFLEHAAAEWLGHYCLCYFIHLDLKDVQLKDTIAFADGQSLSIAAKGKELMIEAKCIAVVPENGVSKREDCYRVQAKCDSL